MCIRDRYGRLLKLTEADGSITSYEYDVMDRITAVTDAEGHKTTFTYDKVGNIIGHESDVRTKLVLLVLVIDTGTDRHTEFEVCLLYTSSLSVFPNPPCLL